MRLICPRCGAQYEIDASAIPAAGREVECSACEHVWFTRGGPGPAAAPPAQPAATVPPASAPFDPAARPPLSRSMNDSVIEILREEAARELEARTAERQAQRAADRTAAVIASLRSRSAAAAGGLAEAPASLQRAHPFAVQPGPAPDVGTPEPALAGVAESAPPPTSGQARAAADHTAPLSMTTDARQEALDKVAETAAAVPPVSPAANPQPPAAPAAPPRAEALTLATDAATPTQAALPPGVPAAAAITDRDQPRSVAPATAPGWQGAAAKPGSVTPLPVLHRRARAARAQRRHDGGFHLVAMAALIGVMLYAIAPRMAAHPVLGPALLRYHAHIDALRDRLDSGAGALVAQLSQATE